jgi:ADP-dependent NAD(P)H-hydrate dehydratase / NAD(P)H-hydrate epimerase
MPNGLNNPNDTHNQTIVTTQAIRSIEKLYCKQNNITLAQLMDQAGLAAWQHAKKRWPKASAWALFLGKGNNAGDAAVFAKHAHLAGDTVHLYLTDDTIKSPLLNEQLKQLKAHGILPKMLPKTLPDDIDVVVDGLLGIRCNRPLSENIANCVSMINESKRPILSIDIPSGVCADTGYVGNTAVRATETLTYFCYKLGLFRGAGKAHSGQVYLESFAHQAMENQSPIDAQINVISKKMLHAWIPQKPLDADKKDQGHLVVIGGDEGYLGAALLACQAAIKVGVGRVTLVTQKQHAAILSLSAPCVMTHGFDSPKKLKVLLSYATAVVIGPGLGQGRFGRKLLKEAMLLNCPLLLDADALNLIAKKKNKRFASQSIVFTPHLGEAGRLLNVTRDLIAQQPSSNLKKIIKQYKATTVLKGAGSLIASPTLKTPYLCTRGNPGMAQAGSGDVLAGTIGALMAMGSSADEATLLGVYLHAWSADRHAAKHGIYGMPASEWLDELVISMNTINSDTLP